MTDLLDLLNDFESAETPEEAIGVLDELIAESRQTEKDIQTVINMGREK